MELAVVVPTLNSRDRLAGCLDALAAHAPDVEVVVVNGPSTDGTSGFVREHAAVDRLVEVADRNLNVARNAGITAAGTEAVAFVGQCSAVEADWLPSLRDELRAGASVVTGPVHRSVTGGVTTETLEETSIAGRAVTYFDGGNVAFARDVLDDLDGFDEYLHTGGARDAAHRLAAQDYEVTWQSGVSVLREEGDDVADRTALGEDGSRIGLKYRSLGYRLAKNYGPRPTVWVRLARHAGMDGWRALRGVLAGEETPSSWLGHGRDVATNIVTGARAGLRARRNGGEALNPNGVSVRMDRAVARYDS